MASGSGTSVAGRQLLGTMTTGEIGVIVWVNPASGLTDGQIKKYGLITLEPRAGTPARRYALAKGSIWTNGVYVRGAIAVGGTEIWANWRESGIPYRWLSG